MGVQITDIKYYNEFRGEYTNYLLGNIGDKIRVEITFQVITAALASAQNPIVLNKTSGVIGDGWCYDAAGRFKDFNIGDTVLISNYITGVDVDTRTIVDKTNDRLIKLDADIDDVEDDNNSVQAVLSVATPVTAVKFLYNFIENSEQLSFLSKTTGTEQAFIGRELEADDTAPVTMDALGVKGWQIGSATVEGVSIDASPVYTSTFKVKHYTYITPFMLYAQWEDILQDIAPAYLRSDKSLKYVTRIFGMTDYNNPNILQVADFYKLLGNVGWFNENFDQGPTKYFLSGLSFKNADGDPVSAIELTEAETDVEFFIENTDAVFSDNNTKFTLNFCKAPATESEYVGNAKTMPQNFIFDRALQTVGSAGVNGDNYGGDYQVLKSVEGTYVTVNKIKITCKIALSPEIVASLSDLDEKRYMLFVAVQDHTLETNEADRTTLLVSAENFYENFADLGLVQALNVFLRHPEEDPDIEGQDSIEVFPEDEIVGRSVFFIDKGDLQPTDNVQIKKADVVIKAKNTVSGQSFILQKFTFDFSTLTEIQGAQYVDVTIDRNYHIPAVEPRRFAKVKRRLDLDNDDRYYYNIDFAFLWRWEYWTFLKNVNQYFFDINEPLNGFNNEWTRYKDGDWKVYYAIQLSVAKNGKTSRYEAEDEIVPHDYASNSDYTATSIKSYDNDTDDELYDAGQAKRYILGYKDTRIVATFTKSGDAPEVENYAANFGIEIYEQGGEIERRRLSTVWESDGDTWLKSIDMLEKASIEVDDQDIIVTCLIDNAQIPKNFSRYKIVCRLYDLTVTEVSGKITEAGLFKITEDGFYTKVLE